MYLVSILLSLVTGDPFILGISPELDTFTTLSHRKTGSGPQYDVSLTRQSGTNLYIECNLDSSPTALRERVHSGFLSGLMLPPPEGSPAWNSMFKSFSGHPLGDTTYRIYGGSSCNIQFSSCSDGVYVSTRLYHAGRRENGRIVWSVGDIEADKLLVEDVNRRVISRVLAWHHFDAVRENRVPSNVSQITSRGGVSYISVANWATSQNISTTAQRSVGRTFSYRSRDVFVIKGANKIRVAGEWVPLGGFALEVGNASIRSARWVP